MPERDKAGASAAFPPAPVVRSRAAPELRVGGWIGCACWRGRTTRGGSVCSLNRRSWPSSAPAFCGRRQTGRRAQSPGVDGGSQRSPQTPETGSETARPPERGRTQSRASVGPGHPKRAVVPGKQSGEGVRQGQEPVGEPRRIALQGTARGGSRHPQRGDRPGADGTGGIVAGACLRVQGVPCRLPVVSRAAVSVASNRTGRATTTAGFGSNSVPCWATTRGGPDGAGTAPSNLWPATSSASNRARNWLGAKHTA